MRKYFDLAIRFAAVALFIASTSTCVADDDPRNNRFEGCVIEYVSIEPRLLVKKIGSKAGRPNNPQAKLAIHIRNLNEEHAQLSLRIGEYGVIRKLRVNGNETATLELPYTSSELPYGQTISLFSLNKDSTVSELLDTASIYKETALRVGLLVEEKTLQDGNERFGSFIRRMRKSFESLHELFDDTSKTTGGDVDREKIQDRFRIDFVDVYQRDELPEMFWNHPSLDVVIACDEGGPLGGFYVPAYSIGHNFFNKERKRGIWSRWGEQAMWHELLHFRGVPDYYIYPIPAKALPGRWPYRINLPARYREDILCDTYREDPRIGNLTTKVANFKQGVARVGACEDTNNRFGHMWKWIPEKLNIRIVDDGKPIRNAKVEVYRSMSAGLPDGRIQGVAADRMPDLETRSGSRGEVLIEGDYMGAKLERSQRSLWLLVEVHHDNEMRFEIVWGLWLNERWIEGDQKWAELVLEWNKMKGIPTP